MEKKTEQYDVVIIGEGAAGLTTAIYCGRARLKALVIKEAPVGGLATCTNEIESCPGFPEGNADLGLMELFHKQAKKFGVKFKLTDVHAVWLEGDTKVVETSRTNYECHSVTITSGRRPRLTGAPGEDRFLYGKGISFCVTCDVAANAGKTVMVIGSGDTAIEEGMFLTKFASRVIVSVMYEEGKVNCNEIAREEAPANPKMGFIWNTLPEEFRGDERHLHSVTLKDLRTSEIVDVSVDTCFLFIDYVPNTEIFKDVIDVNRSGYMLTNEEMGTSIPGVFAAGNVHNKFLRQVTTAVDDNAIAGYVVEKYLVEDRVLENQIMNPSLPDLMHIWNTVETTSRGLLPVIEGLEQEHGRSAKVTEMNIYKSAGITNRLGITTVPSVAFTKDGKLTGVLTEDTTREAFRAAL